MSLQKDSDKLTVPEKGINALDICGEKATGKDFAKVEALMRMNYGVDYPLEKFQMLFELLAEEGWTGERLKQVAKWFLKNKKFPSWTIADWFDYSVKLYPYSWYCKNIAEGVRHEEMEAYKVKGSVLWKMKDGIELPLEKI